MMLGNPGGATTGIGDLGGPQGTGSTAGWTAPFSTNGTATIDTASTEPAFQVTVAHSVASANLSIRKHYALLELW
jgi:hypothetical protein